jgi:NTE family protein
MRLIHRKIHWLNAPVVWAALLCAAALTAGTEAIAVRATSPTRADAKSMPTLSTTASPARPKIGLALSGGGARGAAHIGVLKVLEENRVPIHYIAGTSMGALVGALYASGMSPHELETRIARVDWLDAFNDNTQRNRRSFRRKRDDDLYLIKHKPGFSGGRLRFPLGLIDGQKVDLLLKQYTLPVVTIRDFDDLSIPYRAVAADLETGEPIVLDHGDLALAMRASMALPAIFAPRDIGGKLLTDGGISKNLPIDVVRDMGADIVIAVDISTPLDPREKLQSLLTITSQLSGILSRRDADEQIATLTDRDIFIEPDLGDISTGSFDAAVDAIPAGVTATEAVTDKLAPLSVSQQEYQVYLAERGRSDAMPIIDEVRIVNHSRIADAVIAGHVNVKTGEPLDHYHLEKDIGTIYGYELFESVYYDITRESDHTVLTVTCRERSWGPNYLQFGLVISGDFEGTNRFNLGVAYARTAINRLNGEWRSGFQVGQEPGVFSEFFQPLDNKNAFFVHPSVWFNEQSEFTFDGEGNKLSEFRLSRWGAELDVGREMGSWGEVRAGIVRESGNTKIRIGDPSNTDFDFDTGEAFLQFYVDELEHPYFPRGGGSLRLRGTIGRDGLGSNGDHQQGSDSDYEQGTAEGSFAYSVGRMTGLVGGLYETTRDSNAPFQSLSLLGGFTQLSGLIQNELSGQHAFLLSGQLYTRVFSWTLLPLYAGASFEYGNVFALRDDMAFDKGLAGGSAFLGLDTLLGPVYIAYGLSEGGRDNVYFYLGQLPRRDRRTAFRSR